MAPILGVEGGGMPALAAQMTRIWLVQKRCYEAPLVLSNEEQLGRPR